MIKKVLFYGEDNKLVSKSIGLNIPLAEIEEMATNTIESEDTLVSFIEVSETDEAMELEEAVKKIKRNKNKKLH